MTLLLEDRGWVVGLVERPSRTIAVRMTFDGDDVPGIVGESQLPGRHSYFLGNDKSRWRTDVPLYGSVHYQSLYPGIDLRLREMNGVPEYDLLLEPTADLSSVAVRIEGANGLSIGSDGSLVIETALGPLTQTRPRTWQTGRDGRTRQVACDYTLLGADRFAFVAPGWDRRSSLIIDPGLVWSTFVGRKSSWDAVGGVAVDAAGIVTAAGATTGFPLNNVEVFVSRFDPRKTGAAQLVYAAFLGGGNVDGAGDLALDASGVITLVGTTHSADFPTTAGAFATTHGGSSDAFLSRLDPSKIGPAQLTYSTFLGGSGDDPASEVAARSGPLFVVVGSTTSTDFPTSVGAYDTTHNGGFDVFVTHVVAAGTGGVVYSTFLGGSKDDRGIGVSVGPNGVTSLAGPTASADFPMTAGAYDTTYGGGYYQGDVFVARLDPSGTSNAQLVYSTFLGASGDEWGGALSVHASGVMTVAGSTDSTKFPTTSGAYKTGRPKGGYGRYNAFVSRLDPSKSGSAQLVYSTYLGGNWPIGDGATALFVDSNGVVTVAGYAQSANFPTTSNAFQRSRTGGLSAFVSRLDPRKVQNAQLIYSTFLDGNGKDRIDTIAVDASGVSTVAGWTSSTNFPTTGGAYDTSHAQDMYDGFISRLDMAVALYGDVHKVSITGGGTQKLTVNAGQAHANRSYWVFGSVTGTTPGVTLGPVHVPLNLDPWTDYTIALANTALLTNTKGVLNASGTAQALLNIPKVNLPSAIGLVFHHAYLVYDQNNNFYMASNPVPLKLVR